MKKKLVAVLLCGCLAFAGCGSGSGDGEEANADNGADKGESGSLLSGNKNNSSATVTPAADDETDGSGDTQGDEADTAQGAYWAPQGSVVLGNYSGVVVDKVEAAVSDDDVQYEIDSLLDQHSEPVEITDRNTVENGDYVCVDYTLYVDGEEIDSVEDEYLTIGSGYYDFEDGLIGALLSESKTIECEIEDAVYSDYVGETGTYVARIKSINELVTPELTDEFIAENTEFDTVEAYRQSIYDTLLAEAEQDAADDQIVAAFQKIMADSTFTGLSDADVQSYVDEVLSYYEQYASMWGMDIESLASLFFGVSYDEFVELAREDGDYVVKQNLILAAVVDDAGITLTDEEYTTALTEYAAENDFESPEAVEEYYYKEDLVEHFLFNKAYDMIVDSIVVQ